MKIIKILWVLMVGLSLIAWTFLPGKGENEKNKPPVAVEKPVNHSVEFEKKIHKIGERVYSAVGYGLANSIMIEGVDGLIIVDTLESNQAAEAVMAEFRKISPKPVKAIIYTHNHVDHVMGAKMFAGETRPDVYAHETTDAIVRDLLFKNRPIITTRSIRMFGNKLSQEELQHSGIGSGLKLSSDATTGYLRPNKTFTETLETTIAGVKLKLIHAPGETDDQLYVWLTELKVLISGDNYYTSFPNLYTIRGTTYRNLESWYTSVDIIRDIKPEYLVPCHGRPLTGADTIYPMMTNYRDAIQYVHDQGIRAMNQGLTADEMVETIKLPEHLSSLPYLQEYYGKASWSLRSLFAGNLGWFSGDSADLQPLSRKAEARMMADLAGGTDKLLAHAKKNVEAGNNQAALELTGHLLRLEPSNREARFIRMRALKELGKKERNVNARHYYFTEALEMSNERPVTMESKVLPEQLAQFPIDSFMDMLPVNLNAQACMDVTKTVGIRFTDEQKDFTLIIRRGIAEVKRGLPAEADILVEANAQNFKEMVVKIRKPVSTLLSFSYEKGNSVSFGNVLQLFQLPVQKLAYQSLQ
jgi:alkyl sulfatase BDS1-like metallo-beta-lactamase superfamily hydrolase